MPTITLIKVSALDQWVSQTLEYVDGWPHSRVSDLVGLVGPETLASILEMLRLLFQGPCIGNQYCTLRFCSNENKTNVPGRWQFLRSNGNQRGRIPTPFLKIAFIRER